MLHVITCRIYNAASKTEFANNSLKSPKIGKLNIDTLIIPQGLLIHGKKPDQKISCFCPWGALGILINEKKTIVLQSLWRILER